MIHKIHAGEALSQQPYVLGAFPLPSIDRPRGNPINFGQVRYPGRLTFCQACHLDDTYTLPVAPGALPVLLEERTCTEPPDADPDDFCADPFWTVSASVRVPRETAVCTSCHDAPSTAAHAEINTTPDGLESCATCHGPGSTWDVALVHRPD